MRATILIPSVLMAAQASAVTTNLLPHMIGYPVSGINTRGALDKKAQCNADNCARAVTGTRAGTPSLTARLADCSSFFEFTVIPPTSTITYTDVVVESTSITNVEVYNKRQATETATTIRPTAVPAYASACSGSARFSSACSCAGVTPSTITQSAPSVTVTQIIPTETVVVDQIPCGKTERGPTSTAPYLVVCGAVGTGSRNLLATEYSPSWDGCVQFADENFAVNSFEYQLSTGTCNIYQNFDETQSDNAPEADFVFAYYHPGN